MRSTEQKVRTEKYIFLATHNPLTFRDNLTTSLSIWQHSFTAPGTILICYFEGRREWYLKNKSHKLWWYIQVYTLTWKKSLGPLKIKNHTFRKSNTVKTLNVFRNKLLGRYIRDESGPQDTPRSYILINSHLLSLWWLGACTSLSLENITPGTSQTWLISCY